MRVARLFRAPRKLRSYFYCWYNRWMFRLSGIRLGARARIYNNVYLHVQGGASVTIGSDFIFSSGDNFNPLCRNLRGCIVAERATTVIEMGHHVGMSSPCIWAKERITIDDYVNIGGDCVIMDSDAHNLDWRIRDSGEMAGPKQTMDNATAKCAPIHICSHVLIGTRCIILKGVTIGEGSVIAAGSVVTRDIPPHCIAGGNPAKVIKQLEGYTMVDGKQSN